MADVAHTLESSQAQPPPLTLSPEIEQRKAAALELLGTVQARLGRELTFAEWRALNPLGAWSAGELSPIEAEIMVRLVPYGSNRVLFPQGRLEAEAEAVLEQERKIYETQLNGSDSMVVGLVAGGGIAMYLGLQVMGLLEWPFLVAAVVLLAFTSCVALRAHHESLAALRDVAQLLPRSDIIQRLGENSVDLEAIRKYTPGLFSLILFGWRGNTLRDRLGLAVSNLDWFMRPPTSLFRWQWLKTLSSALLVVCSGLCLFEMLGHHIAAIGVLGSLVSSSIVGWLNRPRPRVFFADALIILMHCRQAERIREGQRLPSLPITAAQPAAATQQAASAT